MENKNDDLKTVLDAEKIDSDFLREKYKYQPELTKVLDNLSSDFNQEIINQIVLWKVNRYAEIKKETLDLINKINKEDTELNIEFTKEILEKLLATNGVQLPMASTILRFKNPKIYQIIDQRVYRFLYGENLPKYFKSIETQINLYLEYLNKLRSVCIEKGIAYEESDRLIYTLDKQLNKNNNINY